MSIENSQHFRIVKRRAIRVYDKMSTIVKKEYDDDIFLNALTKSVRCVVCMRKNVEQ